MSAELAGNFVTAEVVENSLQQLNDNLTAEIDALGKQKQAANTDPAVEEMNQEIQELQSAIENTNKKIEALR